MSAILHLPTRTRYLKHVKTGAVDAQKDLVQYRPPYGVGWKVAGSGQPLPETVSITVEVWAASDYAEVTHDGELLTVGGEPVWAQTGLVEPDMGTLRGVVNAIIADAVIAERISTPMGLWKLAGLQSAIPRPIAGGYKLDLTWVAAETRRTTAQLITEDGDHIITTDGQRITAVLR